jgi:ribonuclease P protein subunit RPR2
MRTNYTKKLNDNKAIALSRIKTLFNEARLAFKEDSNLSDRYVQLAKKIATKYKVRIPKEYKKKFCKNCFSYLVPGKNCRVRLQKKKLVYYCISCKHFMRFPYK